MKKFLKFFASFVIVVMFVAQYSLPLFAANIKNDFSLYPEIERKAPIENWRKDNQNFEEDISNLQMFSTSSLSSTTLGPNLIKNPSLESSSAGVPLNWKKGGYGTNTRTFSFPAAGFESSNGIGVSISSYTNGDAKWYFDDIPVTAGATYEFSDYSYSNIPSIIDVRYLLSDGTYRYDDLAFVSPSSTYKNTKVTFVIPDKVVSLTIFHLIKGVGTLVTDEYSLNKVTTEPVPSDPGQSTNYIQNGNFETSVNNLPASWSKGRWGTNTATFIYPASGVDNTKAAQVSISSYTNGDAKWVFKPINLPPGDYTYFNQYKSNIPSIIDIQIHHKDGTYTYDDIAFLPASTNFSKASANFKVPSTAQDITIFHLINRVGNLTIDNALITTSQGGTVEKSIFDTGAVTLSFDDGSLSQYQNAIPKLKSSGLKGTFYIISKRLADYGYSGFMSKAQISEVYKNGNEIGSHTKSHLYLTNLTSTQQQEEILGSRNDLLSMNVGPIESFSYPFGDYDSNILKMVLDSGYKSARSTITGYALPNSDVYQLPRFNVVSTTTFDEVKNLIDNAISNKQWLILAFHQINTSGEFYSTTPAIFNQIVDYLAAKKIPVVNMSEASKSIK